MSTKEANRRPQPGARQLEWVLAGAALAAVLAVVFVTWLSARIAAGIGGQPAPPGNPFTYTVRIATGAARWPDGATTVLVTLLTVCVVVGGVLARLTWRWWRSVSWIDSRAGALSTARDTALLRQAGARADARRLGSEQAGPGTPLGRHGRDGAMLHAPWEWVLACIMGARSGKTTTMCVRQVMGNQAGPVVATSNKPDLVDLTRGPRSELGAVWVFDPQNVIGEEASWWWNPLSVVKSVEDADELAGLLVAAVRNADARTDAYFDTEGQALLSGMLLAAACAARPITQVFTWLTNENDPEPSKILQEHGYTVISDAVWAVNQLSPRQRDGVFGTARSMASFLRNDRVLPWVTPTGPGDSRPQFDPVAFATSQDTIYLVSREGRGTARALTAALTVAIVNAAENIASHTRTGRLPAPMSVVLDEAANVVRWPTLPDLYSHYGSRGIILSTFFQSWSQGVEVWGKTGMTKLWTAANVRIVGPGIAEEGFLSELARLIGDRDVIHRSASSGRGAGRSVQTSLHREQVLSPADLAKMPPGRAVMLTTGIPPTLLRLVHYSAMPYAAKIAASAAYYGAGRETPPAASADNSTAPRTGRDR
ncbi:MAG TPA: TraM recognition domain-containing protein [Kineosporiaceae bacterium]|nr:TraM recognition domain-containing protein [Kineosporiaceae bacterium]